MKRAFEFFSEHCLLIIFFLGFKIRVFNILILNLNILLYEYTDGAFARKSKILKL